MALRVIFWAQAKSAAGCAASELDCPEGGLRLPDALTRLVAKHGDALGKIVLDAAGKPEASALLFVNDEQVFAGMEIVLRDGDVLTLMPPISGG